MGRKKREKMLKPVTKLKNSGYKRGATVSCKYLSREEVAFKEYLDERGVVIEIPKTRAECKHGIRPCPYFSCKYNLYLDVNKKNGSIKFNFPDLGFDELEETCALDIIERGESTLEDIGRYMNLTRERVRQIQDRVIEKLKAMGFPEDVLEYYNIKK